MVRRPASFNAFEFSVLAGLRAAQLARGCSPRVDGLHKKPVIAQMEVATYKVERIAAPDAPVI
jgi:DNA-directed RNA polymerase subunit K/omega